MFSSLSRRVILVGSVAFALCSFTALQTKAADSQDKTIKVGVVSGPEEDLAIVAKNVAKTKGLNIQLIDFDDYNLPNEALVGKDIDANAFQHIPFMDAQVKARGYKLAVVGKTWVEPLGFYSHKIKSLKELPDGAKIGIQNDPSNQGRALNLLAKQGLIKLKKDAPTLPSLADITENPHHYDFIELDAAQLARSLDDVSMASINTNYVISAKIDPKTVLLQEDRLHNPYANIIVVRKGDENRPEIKTLVESFQSDAVKKAMEDKYHGAILPAWQ
ncbi:MetQ/NlpA family ABC transporter substrate-binding protein [Commensalibacter nepenthis]|uniref:Lipoprotein n=1 Tax=Commensalibacter nepenthis TaxID=3043872 RepID=A0ABT6Q5R0_9PROT|nr:MetQ/NlpA family ABC transporter substrate-binding protein [Commensalibacter sp. TBRC 10068]MDI2112234.1 MetQ/NlpA family ABC transporter substrate-binding protein [Commensalibacter sp. TBRC 10068]